MWSFIGMEVYWEQMDVFTVCPIQPLVFLESIQRMTKWKYWVNILQEDTNGMVSRITTSMRRTSYFLYFQTWFSFLNTWAYLSLYYSLGGLLAKSTGVIYAFPAHSNEVLCVDTNIHDDNSDLNEDQSWRVSAIPIKRHADDIDQPELQYKWLGGSYGADGW